MKVMQINVVYNSGSTGKIVYDIHTELEKQGVDSVVCYGRGEKTADKNVYKVCGEFYSHINHFWANLSGVVYGGCLISTNKLISVIKKEKPDVVHLHCINGYFVNIYRLINWLKNNNIKTVLTLHAEFMYTGGCGHSIECTQWSTRKGCGHSKCPRYRSDMGSWLFDRSRYMWKKMKKAFEGFNENLVVTSVSPWLMLRAKQSPILGDKEHLTVYNGIDTDVFCPVKSYIKQELGISDKKVVFHATASFSDEKNHFKGGYYIIELAKRMPDVVFVVAGLTKEGITVPENVILLGKVTDQNRLAELYSMADVTVITSKKETFSMIVAESLCCGTPVVGFKAGAPEMIALTDYCEFAEQGDIDSLEKAVIEKIQNNNEIDLSETKIYSKEYMAKEYLRIYKNF